jgi:hypothetical protein
MAKHVSKRKKRRRSSDSGERSEYNMRGVGKVRRRKGGPSKHQIETEPTLATVLKNTLQFGTASKCGKLFRHTFTPLTASIQDPRYSRRLQAVFTEAIKTAGSLETNDLFPHLKEFKAFPVNELPKRLRAEYIQPVYSHDDGLRVKVTIDNRLNMEQGKRVFILSAAAASLEFVSLESSALVRVQTEYLPLGTNNVRETELHFPALRIDRYVFLCIGIRCYDPLNGNYEKLSEQTMTGAWIWLLDKEKMGNV